MQNIIGARIAESREQLGLTQDQFGARYGVSGPAIFKFEKGYVKPSLDLWLKMARDCDIAEKKAVLLWVKAKLPEEYQAFIDLSAPAVSEAQATYTKEGRTNYSRIGDLRDLRDRLAGDTTLPKNLKALVEDNELWVMYRPTGQEIQMLIEKFGKYTDAKESLFRDAIRLIREFIRSEY